jgi:hypothetical protein
MRASYELANWVRLSTSHVRPILRRICNHDRDLTYLSAASYRPSATDNSYRSSGGPEPKKVSSWPRFTTLETDRPAAEPEYYSSTCLLPRVGITNRTRRECNQTAQNLNPRAAGSKKAFCDTYDWELDITIGETRISSRWEGSSTRAGRRSD